MQLNLDALQKLVAIVTVPGLIFLCILILTALILVGYMLMHFGEASLATLMPLIREVFSTLRSETQKSHPAIRLELALHLLFGLIAFVCLGAILLHSLIPWVRPEVENFFVFSFISSFIVCVLLAGVSIRVARRLD